MIARFDAKSRRWPVVAAGFGLLFGALALSGVTRAADKADEKPAGAANVPARGESSSEKKAAKNVSEFSGSPLSGNGGGAGLSGSSGADEKANARAAEKLKKPLERVDFEGVALGDALDFVRDAAGVDIMVEWPALEQIGVTRDARVTLRLHQPTSADAVLSLMFRGMGGQLQHEIDKGVVVISPSIRQAATVMQVYDVSDLIGGKMTADVAEKGKGAGANPGGAGLGGGGSDSEVEQLIALITATIQPEGWTKNGGSISSIGVFKNKMVVKAPENIHREVAALLEALRDKPGAAAGGPKR